MGELIPIKKIIIENGAIKSISYVLDKIGVAHCKVMVVCDNNTYNVAGKYVASQLENSGYDVVECVLEREGSLIPDERALGEILIEMDRNTEFLIAVGSGTLNDLTRFVSFKTGKPYGIVATAPSMDGYASSVSPLIVKGFKRTYEAIYPHFIIGDTDILSQAPYDMITAGFGDILGKYTSLADWYISSIVAEEAYSEEIADLVMESIEKCVNVAKGIAKREKSAIKELMEALVISGIAMLKSGNSRPASGAEHHLSHYVEMKEISSGKECHFHGTKVGIMSIITSSIYHYVFSFSREDIKEFITRRNTQSRDEYESSIKKAYGPMAEEVLMDLNYFYLDETKRKQRQDKIIENWEYLKKWVQENVPPPAYIKDILKSIGAPVRFDEIGLNEAMLYDALTNAKEVRRRYTILRLAEDVGLDNKRIYDSIMRLQNI